MEVNQYQKKKKQYKQILMIGNILSVIILLSTIPLSFFVSPIFIPLNILFYIISRRMTKIHRKKIENISYNLKNQYIPQLLKKHYPDCSYFPDRGLSKELVSASRIIKMQEIFHSEDLIEGSYEGVHFRSADVKIKDRNTQIQGEPLITFLGRMYEFEFPKSFRSDLLIIQPKNSDPFGKFKKIETESTAFNSELQIFTTNEHEALHILTPHFMERLLKLDRKYQDKIFFSFIHNKLYIAVNTKVDTFDLKMFRPSDHVVIENYKTQLQDIQAFIHELNLDQDIFAKD